LTVENSNLKFWAGFGCIRKKYQLKKKEGSWSFSCSLHLYHLKIVHENSISDISQSKLP